MKPRFTRSTLLALVALVGCGRDPSRPDPSTIGEGPLAEAIRRGELLVTHTPEELPDNARAGLRCTSCHLAGGTAPFAAPWIGITGRFPMYRARSGKVDRLEDRINDCFERSLNGKPLADSSPEMAAIMAYMAWLSRGQPIGETVRGNGFKRIEPSLLPDRARGAAGFVEKCSRCHGLDGQGRPDERGLSSYPPIWGERSFTIGAGMARLDTAAAFIRQNMPFDKPETLTDQEAYDIADYVIHQPRPDFAGKVNDWPKGDKPRDSRY